MFFIFVARHGPRRAVEDVKQRRVPLQMGDVNTHCSRAWSCPQAWSCPLALSPWDWTRSLGPGVPSGLESPEIASLVS